MYIELEVINMMITNDNVMMKVLNADKTFTTKKGTVRCWKVNKRYLP